MNEDTCRLLQECTSGCSTAMESMEQVMPDVQCDELARIIGSYKEKHKAIWKSAGILLHESGNEDKHPGVAASSFMWVTTEMKLLMKNDDHQIAKLMMDGCNMGIQSICRCQNQYEGAEPIARDIARQLVKTEEEFMEELKGFL